jgi:hypothetical protein
MNKIQKIKFGMKVLKGRCVIARGATPGMGSNNVSIAPRSTDKKSDDVVRGATPGMGSNNVSIAPRSTDKKSDDVVWGATPGMGSNDIFIAPRSTDKKSDELNNYFVRLVTL